MSPRTAVLFLNKRGHDGEITGKERRKIAVPACFSGLTACPTKNLFSKNGLLRAV